MNNNVSKSYREKREWNRVKVKTQLRKTSNQNMKSILHFYGNHWNYHED